jgi:hypothetical protein
MKIKRAGIHGKLPTAAFVSITIVATAACGQESSVLRDLPQLTGDAGSSPSLPIVSKKPSDNRTRLRGRFWRWLHPESPSQSGRENREAESVRDRESGHISRSVQPVRSPGEAPSSRAVDLPLHSGNGPAMDRPIGGDSPGGKVDAEVSPTYFQDFLVSPETRSAVPGSQADLSFLDRFYQALFVEEPNPQEEGEAAQPRRLAPAPYQSPPFPFSEHLGPIIGIRDDAVWPLMEVLEKGRNGDWWK